LESKIHFHIFAAQFRKDHGCNSIKKKRQKKQSEGKCPREANQAVDPNSCHPQNRYGGVEEIFFYSSLILQVPHQPGLFFAA